MKKAIALRNPALDIIHNSDRGGQYASHDYRKFLKDYGIVASMSGKRNCQGKLL